MAREDVQHVPPEGRVDVGGVTLAWGNASEWKARLRDESQRRYLALPFAERVRTALALIMPATTTRRR